MTRNLSDVLRIMRLATGRRNANDPDSDDDTMVGYVNDFYSLEMGNDVQLFEQFGTLSFDIDENQTGAVYEFPGSDTSNTFANLTQEVMISLATPANESVSWQPLQVCFDPGVFYARWGINNLDILVTGFPTEVLFYGNEMVFRTLPDTTYTVNWYGYKKNADFDSTGNPELPFDEWVRYIAYGAARNYAVDYGYDAQKLALIDRSFAKERKQLLKKTHNQKTVTRGYPSF